MLEIQRHAHLALGGERSLVVTEQGGDRLDRHGRRKCAELVLRGELGVLSGPGDGRPDLVEGWIGGVGVAEPARLDQADPHPPRLGERQPLDLALVRGDLGPSGLLGVGLHGLVVPGGLDGGTGQLGKVSHPCLPR